ncbi:integral membrane family protein [Trema orientale]|uniref:Integral membrane family protein n=1 Tax=Trema orientale TaxID=63057 RepID=A0A2P5F1W3_TREOI|nr:integral membrane family protein [Trema orientale]
MAASRLLACATTPSVTDTSTPPKLSSPAANSNKEAYGSLRLSLRLRLRSPTIFKCKALRDGSTTSLDPVYQGVYGPWTVEPADVREVISYRSGLVTAAASFVVAASAAFWPQNSDVGALIDRNLDLFYLVGGASLGVSLLLIHIYVTPIKRTLQALWGLGALGSLLTYTALAAPAGQGLVQYVVHNPTAVWFVGPLFAALTGVVFKEGLCYGKLEAGLLTFIIPSLLLGHLTGLMDDGVKLSLLGAWMLLFVIFSGRKFSQPIKDDIGDKSVFMFNSLHEDEKAALIEKLEQQELGKNL